MKRIILLLVLMGAVPMAAQQLHIRGGLTGGTYDPDLEKKFRNDQIFGALLGGGIGMDTPWEGKSAGGLALGVSYKPSAWLIESDTVFVSSKPSYNSLNVVSGSTSGLQFSINQLTNTRLADLTRTTTSLHGGYTLTRAAPGHEITLIGGLRQIMIHANYDTVTAGSVVLGSASAALLGKSLEGSTSARGIGPEFGAEYSYNFAFGGRVTFRGLLHSAAGKWEYRRINVTAVGSSASGLWREEDGLYHVTGRSAALSYSHPVTERVRLFGTFSTETSETRDLKVKLFRLPAPVSSSDFSNFLVDTALTYPGSHSTDHLSGITFGAEVQLL